MSNPNIQVNDLVREMTDEEYSDFMAYEAEREAVQAEQEAKVVLRQSALAKLAALGLTEAEIAAL
jgi:hypothetical protein